MLSTILLLLALWTASVVVVLALARLLGRLTTPVVTEERAPEAVRPPGNVVPLVPRARNELQRAA